MRCYLVYYIITSFYKFLLFGNSMRFLWFWLLLLFYLAQSFSFLTVRFQSSLSREQFSGFHPFWIFSPTHWRLIRDTLFFIFHSFSFYRECWGFEGAFTQSHITLHFFCNLDENWNTPIRILLYFWLCKIIHCG